MSKKFFIAALALCLSVIMTVSVFAELSLENSASGGNMDLSDLIEVEIPENPDTPTPTPTPDGSSSLLAHWKFDEVRGNTVTDSVGNKTATLSNATFEAGINGNGVRFDGAKDGMIDFGERGITSLIDGKSQYSISMWIMPSYYLGAANSRLFTLGATSDGNALLDVNWGKYNAPRKGISASVRAKHSDKGFLASAPYTLSESVIPNLAYMSKDSSRTFGVWQMLTVTVDVTTGTCNVYINEQKLISKSFSPSVDAISAGTEQLLHDTLGYNPAAASTMAFNGVVDDFRVYNGILSEQKIKELISEQRDMTSPTADQKLVEALVTRMGGAAVLYRGSSNALLNGMIVKLDEEDYSLATVFKNRTKVYVPKAFALSYFGLTEVEADEEGYVELNALCEANGYELYYSFAEKLAIITPKGVESFSGDNNKSGGYTNLEYRQRMIAFFENPYYTEPTTNTEQSRTVVYTSEEFEKWVYSPSVCTLNGVIYASCDIKSEYTLVFASKDGGATWTQMSKIDKMRCATLFAYDNQLVLLGLYINNVAESIGICGTRSVSEDSLTWTAVSTIRCEFLEKSGHCSSTPVLFANGRMYKAFEDSNVWALEGSDQGSKKAFVLSCDLNDNILSGSNWIASNYVTITADWTMEQIGTSNAAHHGTPALEGNMVQAPDGTIYNILRLNCEPANGYAVCLELSADGKTLSYPDENKVINFPGGENKFNIRYDETTGYYLSLVNNNTAPYWPMQRNVLSLVASKDLVTWEIVDTILIDRTMLNFDVSMAIHAFQYVDWCFDGDDIIFTVRETMGDTNYFHNGYDLTFYRLTDYKALLDYTPAEEQTVETGGTDDTEIPKGMLSGKGKYFLIGGIVAGVLAVAGGVTWFVLNKKRKKTL